MFVSVRWLMLRCFVGFSAAGCVLALAGGSAQATLMHTFLPEVSKQLSEGVPGEGQFADIHRMTVNSGELYVADFRGGNGESRIDKFAVSSGAFASQFPQISSLSFLYEGLTAVGQGGAERVYVAGDETGTLKGVVAVLDGTGAVKGEWKGTPGETFGCFECQGPAGIAVDQNPSNLSDWAAGDVYVTDRQKAVVDVFKPLPGGGEEYVTQIKGPEPPSVNFSNPVDVAVNQSSGEVLVVDQESGSEVDSIDIFKPGPISPGYAFVGKLAGPPPTGVFKGIKSVIVDGDNGEIYVTEQSSGVSVVSEFDAAGTYLGNLKGIPVGASGETSPFQGIAAVTVDPLTHDVYVAESKAIDVFGPGRVLPTVTTGGSVTSTTSEGVIEATLNGTVNPEKGGAASCRFEYGTSKEFGETAACEPETVAEGASGVAVHATLSAASGVLAPDTTYFYRLQATNKNGTNHGEPAEDGEFTTPGPALLASVLGISSTSATLNAKINPHEHPTTYYFQYGKSRAYEAQVPAPPGISVGSQDASVEVEQHLQTLAPDTLYHYRVLAVSEVVVQGKVEPVLFAGPDQTFRTQAIGSPLALPDGRQWEQVSPVNKSGATLGHIGIGALLQASPSGNAMTYLSYSPIEQHANENYAETQILSSRNPNGGWSSQSLTRKYGAPRGDEEEYEFFSSDLSLAIIKPYLSQAIIKPHSPGPLAPETSPPDSEITPYVQHDLTCALAPATCFEPLLTGAPGYENVPGGTKFGGKVIFVDATPDLSHVIVLSSVALTKTPTNGEGELYEWSAGKPVGEELQMVSVLPNGEPAGGSPGLGFGGNKPFKNALSNDGSRIVWQEDAGATNYLYMRDMRMRQTVQLDATQGGSSNKPRANGPQLQVASSDGSKVFFSDEESLTTDAGASLQHPDLYECEMAEAGGKLSCKLHDLTPPTLGEGADLEGHVLDGSEDGSWVYFVANGKLAKGAVHGTCVETEAPIPGELCNLYVWHDGVTKLVAVVSGEDSPDWLSKLSSHTARVSPDGKWLAFMSQRDLSGYDTRDAVSGKPDEEVYLYDAEAEGGTGRVICASCNPTGARPAGVESGSVFGGGLVEYFVWNEHIWLAANIPGWTSYGDGANASLHQSRYLSDGGRLFFNSHDALVPQDINNNQDVYEYEPVGEGSCSTTSQTFSAASDGCVGLVSSGIAVGESAFVDASEGGGDVFFLTGEKLVAHDFDSALDMYDAHLCTGEAPCSTPTVPPPVCTTADACRAAPSPQPPVFGAPASATFSGAGNVTRVVAATAKTKAKAVKCGRGLVKKKNRCVKAKAKRRKVNARKASYERRAK